jgi:calcineurin-like phosphoesterase family protein
METLKINTRNQDNLYYHSGKIYFYSDFHAGHTRDFILGPRGFTSAEESKNTLINNWNSKVTNNDVAFLLGDTVVGALDNSCQLFSEVISSLNYKELYLMPGNHSAGYRQFYKKVILHTLLDEYGRLTTEFNGRKIHLIPNIFEVVVNNILVVLSHFCIFSYNSMNKNNTIHLFGHSHGNLKNSELGRQVLTGRCLEVTPESIGLFPIEFNEVVDKLKDTQALLIDHH